MLFLGRHSTRMCSKRSSRFLGWPSALSRISSALCGRPCCAQYRSTAGQKCANHSWKRLVAAQAFSCEARAPAGWAWRSPGARARSPRATLASA